MDFGYRFCNLETSSHLSSQTTAQSEQRTGIFHCLGSSYEPPPNKCHQFIIAAARQSCEPLHNVASVRRAAIRARCALAEKSVEYHANDTYLVQSLDDRVVVLRIALDHAGHWIREPFFEFTMGLEHVRHEEMHQRPQFHEIVLQWRASQQQPSGSKRTMDTTNDQ